MKSVIRLTRREVLRRGSAAVLAGVVLPRPKSVHDLDLPKGRVALSETEWNAAEAVAGRIVPEAGGLGAIVAGCVFFIDKTIVGKDADAAEIYRAGLAALDELATMRHGAIFSELVPGDQDRLLRTLESDTVPDWSRSSVRPRAFFRRVRDDVVTGLLSDPGYGGNRERSGWQLSGYPGPIHASGGIDPRKLESLRGSSPPERGDS